MNNQQIFRIIFHNNDQCYELYAEKVYQSNMHGFVVVEDMLFEEKSTIVVDPAEEKLKSEFKDVNRTFVPMHQVIRIDQVNKQGKPKIWADSSSHSKITALPNAGPLSQ